MSDSTHAESPRRRSGLIAKLTLLVVVSVITLVAVEIVLRVIGFEYIPIEVRLIGQTDWREHHVFRDEHFEYDRDLIWKPRANFKIFNEDSYRGPKLLMPKPEGEFRVIAVGDSNTLGWSQQDGPNWPLYFGDVLREAGLQAVVANAGVYGYSSYQGLVRLRQMLELDPDLILWSFGGNDCQYAIRPDAEFAKDPVRQSGFDAALMNARVGQLVLKALDSKPAPEPGEGYCRVPWTAYRENLQRAVALCKEKGVSIVLMTRPYVLSFESHHEYRDSPYYWTRVAPGYREIDIEVAKATGTTLVDFKAQFSENPEKDPIYVDESHFTERGHRLAARFLYEQTKHLLPQ